MSGLTSFNGAAFLARIPTNLADKAICTFAGWGLFELAKKLHPAMRG